VALEPRRTSQAYLGTASESSVPLAELTGIVLALQLATSDPAFQGRNIEVYTDNQGALQTLENPGQASGQGIVKQAIDKYTDWQQANPTHTVRWFWIRAHVGVPGNELADQMAKEATGWRPNGQEGIRAPRFGDGPRATRSAAERWIKARADTRWKEEWKNGKSGATLRQLLPTIDKRTIRLYDGLTRAEAAVLIQLRTGKIGLKAYLAKIGAADSEACHCGMGAQTPPQHINRLPGIRQYAQHVDKS
jgi:ribonuclease HI